MKKLFLFLLTTALLANTSDLQAQGTAFTYQGRLNDGGAPANGSYDFQFIVYDNNPGGSQQGPVLTNAATAVSNGLFTVILDFGQVFPGANRWLDIAVRTNGGSPFTELSPRQPLTPTPYAITAGGVTPGAGLAGTYGAAVTLSNAANSFNGAFTGNGSNVSNVNAVTLNGLNSSNFWQLGGNNVAGGQFLGSTNNQPVEIHVNNQRVIRFAYASNSADGVGPNVIGGFSGNFVSNGVVAATISGGGNSGVGNSNQVLGDFGTVLGGAANVAGNAATVGGIASTASGDYSTALGFLATASGQFAIAIGAESTASGDNSTALGSSSAGGYSSTALGDSGVKGEFATALGNSEADGLKSFAAGDGAWAAHDGCFVWEDNSTTLSSLISTAPNQFLIQAVGGVGIGTNAPAAQLHVASSNGAPQVQITQNNASDYARLRMNSIGSPFWEMDVSPGASPSISFWNVSERMVIDYNGNVSAKSFTGSSDRNLKENFKPVSPREVLDKVAALPITRWNFKDETATPHLGPMAQDFYAAFALGMDDKHIATVDEDGVALAAIQGLNQKLEEQRAENFELKARLTTLEKLMQNLKTKGD